MKQAHLLASARFLPVLCTQFFVAMNSNLFKYAVAMLILYRSAAGDHGAAMVSLSATAFSLPVILFSGLAGQLGDRFDKRRVMLWTQAAHIACASAGAMALLSGNAWLMVGAVFLFGLESAFFNPLKYGILPDLLRTDELLAGNAWVGAATFLAVLAGMILGGLIVLSPNGAMTAGMAVVGLAVTAWAFTLVVPPAGNSTPHVKIAVNPLSVLTELRQSPLLAAIAVGISWFWFAGTLYVTHLPSLAKQHLGADQTVVALFLAMFSVGLAAGALLCRRLVPADARARMAPWGVLGMGLAGVDFVLAAKGHAPGPEMIGVAAFITDPPNWRLLADLLLLAVSAGLYVIPLYTLLQVRAAHSRRARTMAANGALNSTVTTVGLMASAGLLWGGVRVDDLLLAVAVGSLVAALLWRKLARSPAMAAGDQAFVKDGSAA